MMGRNCRTFRVPKNPGSYWLPEVASEITSVDFIQPRLPSVNYPHISRRHALKCKRVAGTEHPASVQRDTALPSLLFAFLQPLFIPHTLIWRSRYHAVQSRKSTKRIHIIVILSNPQFKSSRAGHILTSITLIC